MEAHKYMLQGALVPDNIIVQMVLADCMKHHNSNILIDGFPRTLDQAKLLNDQFHVNYVLHLDVPFDEILNRLKGRMIHLRSGRIYNEDFNPPKNKVSNN